MTKKSKRKEAPATVGLQAKPAAVKKSAPTVHKTDTARNITPTLEIANELQEAFDFFNAKLFDDEGKPGLPQCILTLVRLKKAKGYFWPKQWARDRAKTGDHHEIGIDPVVAHGRDDKETLSTLVHEMVHLLVEHMGHGPKRAYHCKRWAAAMNAIGLKPYAIVKGVATRDKETGANCSHDIVKGGAFDKAADDLIAKGFKFSWFALTLPKPEKKKKTKAGAKVAHVCPECEE